MGLDGLCECGCGGKTAVASSTNRRDGSGKGRPRRFINGHNRRRGVADYVVDENGCWIWQRTTNRGYGTMGRNGKNYYAHRWYYEQHVGPIPTGYQIDHLCNMPRCVNPAHLKAVTRSENVRRSQSKLTPAMEAQILASPLSARRLAADLGTSHMSVLRVRRQAQQAAIREASFFTHPERPVAA